jgi:hypothetical protein
MKKKIKYKKIQSSNCITLKFFNVQIYIFIYLCLYLFETSQSQLSDDSAFQITMLEKEDNKKIKTLKKNITI